MGDSRNLDDRHIKHLEMIQAVIGRLGNDSFLVKGWAITVAGVFFGFAIEAKNWRLAIASIMPTLAFWGLDAYFLRSERLFRALYDRVRRTPTEIEPFFMGATGDAFVKSLSDGRESHPYSLWRTLRRPTLALLYGALVAAGVLTAIAICL
jgi:hypothetical protein